ncbi:hypothetical protein DBR47_03210 [Paucibacter sp. KBW04]|uniref:DUF2846 domain-containing protein n=1 Tax=Paucibacter sp. KBW04 TaxID=2153361 RepID=UPI000F589C12|nr:DUF2846 domain-containing protein [Paucibacter sp. KBW04]RQO63548.1 hypothetical protein DBR47_03210 [Paucibacter sp. KBW04]
MKKLLLTTVLALNLVGCASVKMGDPHQDIEAKRFIAPKDAAAVYVYRNETMGAAVGMEVLVDGKLVGKTGANTFVYKELAPGKHTIQSVAENTDALEIDAKPGVLYYIWQEVKMGVMYARTKLHLVDEARGKKGVSETKLVESK